MCLVRGCIFKSHVISIALELSTNYLQCTISSSKNTSKTVFISFINHIIGIKSFNDCDIETYSAYVADREMTVYSLESHTIVNLG